MASFVFALIKTILGAFPGLAHYEFWNGLLGLIEYRWIMEFLNYHHLRYFWVTAKEGGLRKAAEKLHVSQPTISAQIASLEAALGEKLFRRGGRSLSLTDAGQRALGYAEEIFAIGQELIDSASKRTMKRPLRVRIGITDSLPKLVSYEIIKPVFALAQPVQAVCREGKAAELLVELAADRLDLVLADEPAPSSLPLRVFNHRLGASGMGFCAAPKLAAVLKRRFPRSLDDAPALLPSANCALRRSLEKWFSEHALRPRLIAEFDDMALMAVAAAAGLGFMPMPAVVAKAASARYGLEDLGVARRCEMPYYAISGERSLTHAAVVAITEGARAMVFSS